MNQSKKYQTRSEEANELKNRVAIAVDKMPRNYLDILLINFPEFNTVKGGMLINNVRRGKCAHRGLTEAFEKIAEGKLTLATKPLEFEVIDQG